MIKHVRFYDLALKKLKLYDYLITELFNISDEITIILNLF
jgi:hypothetical protein